MFNISSNTGNTLGTTINLTSNTQLSFIGYVSSNDQNDFYRINLSGRSSLNLTLSGLSGNADVQIIRDMNSNLSIDVNEILNGSYSSGTAVDSINTILEAGEYFIRVYHSLNGASKINNPATSYNASIVTRLLNTAPTNLQFQLNKASYNNTETININSGAVYDANGANDLARVDFKIRRTDGTFVEIGDATNFTSNNWDNRWGTFNHNISLSNLGLTAGNNSVWAIAYDKQGTVSNIVEQRFTFAPIPINNAPNSLQFNINKTTFNPTETITVSNGSVIDANGGIDVARVDFQIRLNNGSLLNVNDATTFTTSGTSANFNYALNLNGLNLASGTHALWGVAYDRQGAASNIIERAFTIASDWFSQNLKDKEVITIARRLAADNKLNRDEMISILRDTQDGGVIDKVELGDLKTLVASSSRFNMDDHVRVLSNKIVNGNTANTYKGSVLQNLFAGSGAQQMTNLIDKWFFGGDRPTAVSGHTFNYVDYKGASLFGQDNKFSHTDIKQGFLGNCYFLSSLGAVALQRPNVIRDMFINNGDGTYTVKFFGQMNGNVTTSADYVTVDSFLPTNVAAWHRGQYYIGQRYASYDNQNLGLWVALAEKAYAQFAEFGSIQQELSRNSYESVVGGNGFTAMPSITGTKGTFYSDINYRGRTGNMFSLSDIVNQLASGKALTTGTTSTPRAGIVGNHEYVIVSANLTSGRITLYNPHVATNNYERQGILQVSYNDFRSNFDIISAA